MVWGRGIRVERRYQMRRRGVLTPLSYHKCHFLFPREAFAGLIGDPVGVWGVAQAGEHARDDNRHNDIRSNESVHEDLVRGRVLDAQQEQADADLAEAYRDECLHPIQPADDGEVLDLRFRQIIHVSPFAVFDLLRDEPKAHEVADHGDDHPPVVRPKVPCNAGAH